MEVMKISGQTFDLKVGYSCNNNCIHCVIEPNKQALIKQNKSINNSYKEIIDIINTQAFKNSDVVVLTGGEITIRRDFLRIIKYIVKKYPNKRIAIQTNARKLKKYVKKIKEISNNIDYVIAIHSMNEDLHNKIVANDKEQGNPFQETIASIKEIIKVHGGFDKNHRIEIVLSKYNIDNFYETLVGLKKLGVKHIGTSYPHLDGFYYSRNGEEKVKLIGFNYQKLKEQMSNIIKFVQNNPDLLLSFEEFPACIWRDNDDKLILDLPNKEDMGKRDTQTSVQFPGAQVNHDFQSVWFKMHKYTKTCDNCYMKETKRCFGVWEEAKAVWGSKGLIPIKKEELI